MEGSETRSNNGLELSLRPFDLSSDVDDFMVWATDDEVSRFCSWETYTCREDLLNYIKDTVIPHPWFRAICLNNRPIGAISVCPQHGNSSCRAELGYVLARKYWGQGIVTKAVKMVVDCIFREWPELERLEALVDVENAGSGRVLEKAGFQKEGILRKYWIQKGRARDMLMYSGDEELIVFSTLTLNIEHLPSLSVEDVLEADLGNTIMSGLIEGLPDAVALRCLARVPFCLHPTLQLVCRSWRTAVHSQELIKARDEVGASEEILCVCAFAPENLWQLYDPVRDIWMTLPILPSEIRHLAHFGVVSTAGKLFVLGGGSDAVDPQTGDHDGIFATDEVWSYDPFLRRWSQRASMLVPRAMFACCVLDGKIVVAGGFTDCRKSISKAEIYDPQKDVWIPIPDLNHTHNSACSGLVVGGKVHVLHKGLSTVQVLDNVEHRWTVEDYGWLHGPMAVVRGEIYVLSHGLIYKQDKEKKRRKVVASASEFQSRIGFAMIGLRDEVYMIGGVIGPGSWNLDIKPLSDVDVLTIGSERPNWHQVTPMTQCHGTMLGCSVLRI